MAYKRFRHLLLAVRLGCIIKAAKDGSRTLAYECFFSFKFMKYHVRLQFVVSSSQLSTSDNCF